MADGNGPRWVRVALIVVALTSAACGGSDGDDSFEASVTTSAAVAATTTVAPPTTDAPETTTTTVDSPTSDPALWLADLNRARRVMSEGLLVQFERLGNPASEGWGTIAFEIEHLEVGIDLVSAFLPALDDPPAALADRAAACASADSPSIRRFESFE